MTITQSALQSLHIGFLGAGSITEAILNGICSQNLLDAKQITVTNRQNDEQLRMLHERFGVQSHRDVKTLVSHSDVLILTMKPKDAAQACTALQGLVRPDQLIISVIAGVSTDLIASWLGCDCPVIRVMPNTSCAIGLSVTGIAAGCYASNDHLQIAMNLFQAVGSVYAIPETDMDIITGLSGSGPAFVYYLVEAMENAGVKAGLAPQLARQLTLETLVGAAKMLLETKEEPAILRRKVTSPGGTTQAGIEVLESYQFQQAMTSAILRAAERSRELGAQYR